MSQKRKVSIYKYNINMAVVRLKRRLSEEPLDAVLLSCKKKCIEDVEAKNENPFSTILKFAGTVKNQAENVALHLSSNLRKDPKTHSHIPDVRSKLRNETKDISQQNRFKVVNCFRALDDQGSLEETVKSNGSSTNLENNSTKSLTVVDVESSNTDVSEDKIKPELFDGPSAEENDHYVYDLYYTGDVDDMLIENLVSVQPLQSDLLYHRRSSSGLSDSDDSEDSNAENNIGNDYPDTEEDNSIDEDDMRAAIRMEDDRFDDLSSDDEDALRISDLKLDPDDVEKYGISRAFCKASKKGDYDEDDYYFDMDSDSDESSRFA